MIKIVCMIPARLGSKRIKKKNIRLLGGIPLISYAIRAAKRAGCFDEIYVNSESKIIEKIALEEDVKFYNRSMHLSTDDATNDEFTKDFLERIDCTILIQLLPTSPFITGAEIRNFVRTMRNTVADTFISVKNQQIECVYKGIPVNFNQRKVSPPSQELEPVQAYACALMGWRRSNYLENMEIYNCGYHGGDGNIGFYVLKGFSEIDVDNEWDFQLAESVQRFIEKKKIVEPKYYE